MSYWIMLCRTWRRWRTCGLHEVMNGSSDAFEKQISNQFQLGKVRIWHYGKVHQITIPFRLTHLAVSRNTYGKDLLRDDENLLKFIESQAEHLRELKLRLGIPSTVYDCVFPNMTKLKCLIFVASQLPQGNEFYDRLKENYSIRSITLHSLLVDDVQHLDIFSKKLPNICSPNLGDSEKILVVAQNVSKLESLSINKVKRTKLKQLSTSMESLYLKQLNHVT